MKKLFVAFVMILSFHGIGFASDDIIFVGGWGQEPAQVREFAEKVSANISIPLLGNAWQLLRLEYPAAQLFESLKEKGLVKKHPTIIAYSWGGRVVSRMLEDHPEFIPEKVIFIGSPLKRLPLSPPEWLFPGVSQREDIPIFVMTSDGDETVSVARATVPAKERVVLTGTSHTGYFSNPTATAQVRSWTGEPTRIVLSMVPR